MFMKLIFLVASMDSFTTRKYYMRHSRKIYHTIDTIIIDDQLKVVNKLFYLVTVISSTNKSNNILIILCAFSLSLYPIFHSRLPKSNILSNIIYNYINDVFIKLNLTSMVLTSLKSVSLF